MILDQPTPYSAQEQDKYREDTALSTQGAVVEADGSNGSIPITEELERQAIYALESRIEATKSYTEARIDRINRNYQWLEQKIKVLESACPIFYPDMSIVFEKVVDNLVTIFSNITDSIEIDDPGASVEEYIIQSLKLNPLEELTCKSAIQYYAQFLRDQLKAKEVENIDPSASPVPEETESYYFKHADIIKRYLKYGMEKSDIEKAHETYIRLGVASGQFCYKKWPHASRSYKLQLVSDGKNKTKKFKKEIFEAKNLKYIPQDTRRLIYRQEGFDDGVIAMIDTRMSKLLDETLDPETGKPLKEAPYDYEKLKEVCDYLKEKKGVAADVEKLNELTSNDEDYSTTEAMRLDGDILLYEAHWIPMVLPKKYTGGITAKSVRCLNSYIKAEDRKFCVRIQAYPETENAYWSTPYAEKDGDCAGMGLPEQLEGLQSAINTLISFSFEYIKRGLYGNIIGDSSVYEDPDKLSNLQPGQYIPLKDMNGRTVDQVMKHYVPPLEVVPYALNMLTVLLQVFQEMARIGPSGRKIEPNPTATEATQIVSELQKGIDRMALRINQGYERFMESCYSFYLIHQEENLSLKVPGIRLLKKPPEMNDENKPFFKEVERVIEVAPEKLFIKDLGFKITAIEKVKKQAVEKQQLMQFLSLLNVIGAYDPKTGTTRKFMDDMGQEVEINFYMLLSLAARQYELSQDEVFKKLPKTTPAPSLATMTPDPSTQSPIASSVSPSGEAIGPSVPTQPPVSSATPPTTGDVLAGAQNVG